jgi:YD repeat-containing protein
MPSRLMKGRSYGDGVDGQKVAATVEQDYGYVVDSTTNLVTSMTDALGSQTTYAYDANDNLRRSHGSPIPRRWVTSIAYQTYDMPKTVTDPLGHVTRFTENANGTITAVADALGRSMLPSRRIPI